LKSRQALAEVLRGEYVNVRNATPLSAFQLLNAATLV